MNTEDQPFEQYLTEVNLRKSQLACLLIALLFPLGLFLDYFAERDLLYQFALIRFSTSTLSIALYFSWQNAVWKKYPWVYGALPGLMAAIALEVMVVILGAHNSSYYAGLNLIILGVGFLYIWSWQRSLALASMIVAIWLIPALADIWLVPNFSFSAFFNNFYFLANTSVIAVAATNLAYRLFHNEFMARSEVASKTAQLEMKTDELSTALEKLREVDRLKNEFFANISHELRTPLTLILTPVGEMLYDQKLPARHRDVLQVIHRNAERLLRLIDDLLDLAKLDAGGLRLNVAELDVTALVMKVVDAFRPAAASRGILLTGSIDVTHDRIFGDQHRLEMVLVNIIGNAFKFIPEGRGKVEVRVRNHKTPQGSNKVWIEVTDNGPGIPESQLSKIFERFHQVDGGKKRRHGGVGIGLALSQELVTLHGGSMSVESVYGQGATFRIELPVGTPSVRPEHVERRQVQLPNSELRRVSDRPPGVQVDSDHGFVLSPSLRPAITAPPYGSFRPSIEATKDFAPIKSSMPPPEVSLRAPAVPRDVRRPPSEEYPADGAHMIEVGALAAAEDTTPILLERGRKARILLAEDNEDLRNIMMGFLREQFDLLVEPDGQKALERIQTERPDLIVSDVMMPNLSGTELCRTIKADPSLATTPVILLTARTGSEAALEAYSAGADDFVAKPFHARLLIARVRAHLKLRSMTLQLTAQSRLALAATLSAGISHEIKNPLNAIMNAAALLKSNQTPDAEASRSMEGKMTQLIADAAQRIYDIVSTLEEHVRPADGAESTFCDVRQGLDATVRLLEYRSRQNKVQIHRDYRSEKLVRARPRELNQVFLNLIDNAIRMAPKGLKNIWVEVYEPFDGVEDVPDPQHQMLAVRVSDDGPGVPAHIKERVFDPFFTTRDVGEGSGLGLYLSKRIVEDAGGSIRVGDRPHGGAVFIVELPLAPTQTRASDMPKS